MPAVKLLSTPGIFLGDKRVSPPRGKTSALLYYLAYHDDWVSRDDLLYLFWPDTDEAKARTNLRQLLKIVKKLPFLNDLEITPTHLCWSVETDVQSFRDCVAKEDWAGLTELYQGSLLEGLHVDKFPEYESWLELERVALFNHYRKAVFQLCHVLEADGRFDEAAEHVERLYAFEPFEETTFRQFLHYLKLSGRQTKALSAYEKFREMLFQEFGAEPDPVTRRLIEGIRAGDRSAISAQSASPNEPQPSLPVPATHFVGREREIDKLTAQLADPACRLLTLVAPGGMGKTRLALETAKRLCASFEDGVCFIPFEAVSAPELMVATMADALRFSFSGRGLPKRELLTYFETKEMLLVLDNLEHLLSDTSLLTDLLTHAPKLKLLATSRERLNLHAEWLFDLEGLALPEADSDTKEVDSVKLFAQSAKKIRSAFELEDENLETVEQICEHVGGMPLALELAASWLRILSPQDILEQLKESLEVLTSSARDMPQRHLAIKKVFEASWSRLTKRAQAALKQLAVFEGGFTKEAATEVSGVGLPLLLLLVNKSFLRQDSSRRFTPHPLMWQFIRQKAKGTVEYKGAKEQHALYFVAFAKQREWSYREENAKETRRELNLELPNIRLAWDFATELLREDLLGQAALSMFLHFIMEARFTEGAAFFKAAGETLSSESLVHAQILHYYGALLNFSDPRNRRQSRALLERSVALYYRHHSPWDKAHALLSLGYNYFFGDYTDRREQVKMWSECAALFEEAGDRALQGRALAVLALNVSNADERETILRQSLAILREQNGYQELSHSLRNLARHLTYTKGSFREADFYIDEATELERQKGSTFHLSSSLTIKGYNLLCQGKLKDAETCFLEVRTICEAAYRGELVSSLYPLVYINLCRDEKAKARAYLEEALTLTENERDKWLYSLSFGAFNYLSLLDAPANNPFHHFTEVIERLENTKNVHFERAWLKIHCLNYYGQLCLEQGDRVAAEKNLLKALHLARTWQFRPAMLHVLPNFAALYLKQNKHLEARRLLGIALHDAASMFQTRDAAKRLLETLPQELSEGGLESSEGAGLEQVITDILH